MDMLLLEAAGTLPCAAQAGVTDNAVGVLGDTGRHHATTAPAAAEGSATDASTVAQVSGTITATATGVLGDPGRHHATTAPAAAEGSATDASTVAVLREDGRCVGNRSHPAPAGRGRRRPTAAHRHPLGAGLVRETTAVPQKAPAHRCRPPPRFGVGREGSR
jgi:hypothetical protein